VLLQLAARSNPSLHTRMVEQRPPHVHACCCGWLRAGALVCLRTGWSPASELGPAAEGTKEGTKVMHCGL